MGSEAGSYCLELTKEMIDNNWKIGYSDENGSLKQSLQANLLRNLMLERHIVKIKIVNGNAISVDFAI